MKAEQQRQPNTNNGRVSQAKPKVDVPGGPKGELLSERGYQEAERAVRWSWVVRLPGQDYSHQLRSGVPLYSGHTESNDCFLWDQVPGSIPCPLCARVYVDSRASRLAPFHIRLHPVMRGVHTHSSTHRS